MKYEDIKHNEEILEYYVICTMYEYFDIFLDRMTMCSHAARILDARFSLKVNGQRVL